MPSPELTRLLDQIRGSSDVAPTEDAYDLSLARSLSSCERDLLIDELVKQGRAGDPRALMTLGYIDAKRAIPDLLALAGQRDRLSFWARRALVELGRGADVFDGLAHDAQRGSSLQRVSAYRDLARLGGPDALSVIAQGLSDADALVRSQAFESLVSALGVTEYMQSPSGETEFNSPLKRIDLLVSSELTPLSAVGARQMQEIVARLTAGSSAQAAGIVYQQTAPPDFGERVAAALRDDQAPIPVDDIRRATGHDRAWAEAFLAVALERKQPRVVEALVDLGAAWTLPAMEAASAGVDPSDPFCQAVGDARRRLASRG